MRPNAGEAAMKLVRQNSKTHVRGMMKTVRRIESKYGRVAHSNQYS
jgi:hypothetical protein